MPSPQTLILKVIQIVPNIITSDLKEAKLKLQKLQGVANWVHLDVIDGKFTDTKTITLDQLKASDFPKNINILVHLMVNNPLEFIDDAKKIGAKVIIGQIEKMPSQKEFVGEVRKGKIKVGLALDDGTLIEKIDKSLFNDLDTILIMTIKAGWSGREFKKERLKEIRKLKELKLKKGFRYKIAVDGGVNKKTIRDCVRAGAEVLFMHSAIWKSRNIKKAIKDLAKTALEDEN